MHITELSGITVDIEGCRNIRTWRMEYQNQNGEGTRIKKEDIFG